jgi:hypothetical protein
VPVYTVTGRSLQRYRQRHLDRGHKQRLQLVIAASTKAQLIRLAGYHNCTLTKLIETLAAEAELAMFRKLPARLADAYLKPKPDARVNRPRRLGGQPALRSLRRRAVTA